jgi:hypothetical protein
MKYFITLTISIIGIFVFGTILETEYDIALNIIFTILAFITASLWEFSVINKNFESDFKLRSQKKTFSLVEIGISFGWTAFILLTEEKYNDYIYIILIFWYIPFAELIMWLIYLKKKPYTILIKENELILNKRWTQKRKLNELTQIQYNRFSNNLKLDFKSKSAISIKTTEYKVEDIQKLLEIMIDKSQNKVFVPQNYQLN